MSTATTSAPTVPAAGLYEIDTTHSTVEGVVRHLMVSKVRARFTAFSGKLELAEDLTQSRIDVVIDAASIDTNEPQRDAHLKSADFLDVENHPSLTFVSTSIAAKGGDRYAVTGNLTILGTTREVVLDAAYLGVAQDPYGNNKAAFSATTSIDREGFGVTWNQALEAGGVMVSKKVEIELEVQANLIAA